MAKHRGRTIFMSNNAVDERRGTDHQSDVRRRPTLAGQQCRAAGLNEKQYRNQRRTRGCATAVRTAEREERPLIQKDARSRNVVGTNRPLYQLSRASRKSQVQSSRASSNPKVTLSGTGGRCRLGHHYPGQSCRYAATDLRRLGNAELALHAENLAERISAPV